MVSVKNAGEDLFARSLEDQESLMNGSLKFSDFGLNYKNLNCSDLIEMILWTTKMSLTKKGAQIQLEEQRLALKWAFHVLISTPFSFDSDRASAELRSLFDLFATYVLFDLSEVYVSPDILSSKTGRVACKADTAALYISYPALEAVLKKHCFDYVASDGKVKKEFKKSNGKNYTIGCYCSSIQDLLLLLSDVADSELKSHMRFFDKIYSNHFSSKNNFFAQIFYWRNSLLHGVQEQSSARIILASLIAVLGLSLYRARFEEMVNYARGSLSSETVHPFKLSHYP